MNSLDTNILIYAINTGCAEHLAAKGVYEAMLRQPDQWLISDQVLFEFYRGLRNSRILERPLTHKQALQQIQFLREDTGVHHCAYQTTFWKPMMAGLADEDRKSSHIFDRVLAVTLLQNGVKTFFTRNKSDFECFGFQSLINPIDEPL